jgi:hypothetical protein
MSLAGRQTEADLTAFAATNLINLRLLAGRETEASPRWTRMESLAGRQSEADLTAFAATNLINLRLLAGRHTEATLLQLGPEWRAQLVARPRLI